MSRYELLYVVPATYAETELQPVIDNVTKGIAALGATVTRNDMVGKLKLTYPIDKVRYGFYVLTELDLEADKLAALNEYLRLHNDVLRHHVVIKDQKAKPVFKLTQMEEIDRERGSRPATSTSPARERDGRPADAAAPAPAKKVEVDMEEVEKKIDKILEGKIV